MKLQRQFLSEDGTKYMKVDFECMRRTLPAVVVCCPSDEFDSTEVCPCNDPTLQTKSLPNTQEYYNIYFFKHSKPTTTQITKILKRN